MRRSLKSIAPGAAVIAMGSCLLGCGGAGSQGSVVARVAGVPITRQMLDRRMTVIAPEHRVPDAPRYTDCIAHQEALVPESLAATVKEECQQQYQALKRQALDVLISSEWLLAEASRLGLQAPSRSAQQEPVAAAQTEAARIRGRLAKSERAITAQQIASYYKANISRFERRERRYIDIVEKLPSEAMARVAMSDLAGAGNGSGAFLHESFDRPVASEVVPPRRRIMRAIFAARPHVVVGPLPLFGHYAVFEVTRIVPSHRQPLAQVRTSIERQLAGEQQRRTLARFVMAWRTRWISRTDCQPGDVMHKCRQYRGPLAPEAPLDFS